MGVESNTYLGPIIKISVKKHTVEEKKSYCSNLECDHNKKKKETHTKFCSECGSVVNIHRLNVSRDIDPFDEDELHDTFMTHEMNNHIFILPNFKLSSNNIAEYSSDSRYEEDFFQLDTIDIPAELAKYLELDEVIQLMNALNQYYTNDEIKVTYSMIQYCS